MFLSFHKHYNDNKELIKEHSFKTMNQFMKIFSSELKDHSSSIDDVLSKLFVFNEGTNEIQNIEKEYINLIFIQYYFLVNPNDKKQNEFYIKLLDFVLSKFTVKQILMNLKLFRKVINFILKYLISSNKQNIKELYTYFLSQFKLDTTDDSKKEIINFFIYTSFYSICKKLNISETFIITPTYINILFHLSSLLQFVLTDIPSNNQMSFTQEITNSFNYIFNKHYFLLKSYSDQSQYKNITDSFLTQLSSEPLESYENYIYIISDLLKYENSNDVHISSIMKKILTSNNGLLHKISINMLNEIKNIDKTFLSKYISVFDVLDGFNSHLFKSLHNELEFIIQYIDNNKASDSNSIVDEDGLFVEKETKTLSLKCYMNYFILLSRKIFNHTNSRIQKYFIKTISNLKIKNSIFGWYLTHDFIDMINNPLLYPENDLITYHSKMGLIIEHFIEDYLSHNFDILNEFVKGISCKITNRRIFIYLMSSLQKSVTKQQNINNPKDLIPSIEKIIESQMKTFSYYNKNMYWITICEIINRIDFSKEKSININRIFYELLLYVINYNKDILSVEALYFGNEEIENKSIFLKSIEVMLKYLKSQYTLAKNENDFVINNNLQSTQITIVRLIYLSLFVNNDLSIAVEYINNNIEKIFSSYLTEENKIEIINNINDILKMCIFFKATLDIPKDKFESMFFNLKKIYLSVITDVQKENDNTITFFIEHFNQYGLILFNYIRLYNQGITDLVTNSFEINKNAFSTKNQYLYSMNYLKMSLFNLLTSIHYNIISEESIKNNNILRSNISNIFTLLKSLTITKDSDKILYLSNISLLLIIMNVLKIDYNSILSLSSFDDLLCVFDIADSSSLFYIFNFFYYYFSIKDNKTSEQFELFAQKGISTLTEKRENFTYMNVLTFIKTIISIDKLQSEEYTPTIKSTINKIIELNENRIWLISKIATESLLLLIEEDISLLSRYSDIIISLSTIRESRGEDSLMINTSPFYIKTPFNISIKKLLPYNSDISKYGLYVRYGILSFINDLIQKHNEETFYKDLISLMEIILEEIDKLSGNKPEMNFTDKHRKKIRLTQLLLTLGQVLKKNDFNLKTSVIDKKMISILNKINLYSVDFYLFNYCVLLFKHSKPLREFLLKQLCDPKAKSHVVTSCLIISSICIVEGFHSDEEERNKFIEAITIQCTSNICNIRGFAQFFINKIDGFSSIKNNYLGEQFLSYLRNNPNIQKFFSKFDDKYIEYTTLIKNFSIDRMLIDTFDEIYNESIPIDIANQFRILSGECMVLDNQDYSKANNSWRHIFNEDDNVKTDFDFQKKYRPIDVDIYHGKTRKRLDVVVVASLVDKIPNLGGLARTCEIFNIGAMTIASDKVLNDNGFLTAASSAERWIPLIVIPPVNVKEFVISYKKMGYTIVGLEQTQNSVEIKKYQFKEKIVIVLGNEKEGIPQELIDLIDHCVIIPQYGEVRSLNVHVSAAIMIWEAVNCILGNK